MVSFVLVICLSSHVHSLEKAIRRNPKALEVVIGIGSLAVSRLIISPPDFFFPSVPVADVMDPFVTRFGDKKVKQKKKNSDFQVVGIQIRTGSKEKNFALPFLSSNDHLRFLSCLDQHIHKKSLEVIV